MNPKESKKIDEQILALNNLSDENLIEKIPEYRRSALPELTPHLIRRWTSTNNEKLYSVLYQFFLDTQKQEELDFFMDAIQNDDFADKRSELVSVLWQSALDSSEYLEDLVTIALRGDYMTIIEVGTVIDSYETGFEDQIILDAVYQIGESIDEETDEERAKLLDNLRQIVNELYAI